MFVLVPVRGIDVQLNIPLECLPVDPDDRVLKISPGDITGFTRVDDLQRVT